MEPVEYIAPGGSVQLVEDPTTMYRLQAAGWRPRPELETLAAAGDQTAVEHLERAKAFSLQVQAEQEAREARLAPKPQAMTVEAEKKPARPRTAAKE